MTLNNRIIRLWKEITILCYHLINNLELYFPPPWEIQMSRYTGFYRIFIKIWRIWDKFYLFYAKKELTLKLLRFLPREMTYNIMFHNLLLIWLFNVTFKMNNLTIWWWGLVLLIFILLILSIFIWNPFPKVSRAILFLKLPNSLKKIFCLGWRFTSKNIWVGIN